ncbi:MAG: UDP-3-O-(3-hydroxymyristoyl)glucosamine N-acyltransferase [Thermodesulfobacteriota bacterium]
MRLNPPRPLGELAGYAGREIRKRLSELGAPNLPFEVEVRGNPGTEICAVCPIEAAEPGSLTFATGKEYLKRAEESAAAAVVVPAYMSPSAKPHLVAPEPRLVFSVILELAMAGPSLVPAAEGGVRFKDRASVDLGPDVTIGDWCYVGARAKIGRGTRIYPQVFLDDDVTIGEDCLVYPRVTLFRNTTLGRRVIIHSGAVIGDDGFGYNQVFDPERGRLYHLKNQHAGSVVLEDFVEVGSQVCIDRGLAGPTVIGAGTKIDNLVQIAHNVRTGKDCIIVSQVGIAGHARLGEQVILFGQVGVGDGVNVGDHAIVNGGTGVAADLPPGRVRWWGRPAQRAEAEIRLNAMVRRDLPRLRDFWRILKKAASFQELKDEFLKLKAESKPEDKDT